MLYRHLFKNAYEIRPRECSKVKYLVDKSVISYSKNNNSFQLNSIYFTWYLLTCRLKSTIIIIKQTRCTNFSNLVLK